MVGENRPLLSSEFIDAGTSFSQGQTTSRDISNSKSQLLERSTARLNFIVKKFQRANPKLRTIKAPIFVHTLDISPRIIALLYHHCANFGMDYTRAIVELAILSQEQLYAGIAKYLNLPTYLNEDQSNEFLDVSIPKASLTQPALKLPLVKVTTQSGRTIFLIAPKDSEIERTKNFLKENPKIAERIKVTTPRIISDLIDKNKSKKLLKIATERLLVYAPELSASHVVSPIQRVLFLCLVLSAIGFIVLLPLIGFVSAHMLLNTFFLSCVGLRIFAFFHFSADLFKSKATYETLKDEDLPIYTALIALYKEKRQVHQLIIALSEINWPKDKLDIKLICESDDPETIDAINAIGLPPYIELIIVPACMPKTKPKALNYALPLSLGDYVVLYDAEDIPHPDQLREAYYTFQNSKPNVVCLQAPLQIHNCEFNWLSAMFAIEYSALFDGLLPALAFWRAPVPLGGTSNHFKRDILEELHAWDPFNVTEDADLAIRLMRLGYRTKTITLPTLEEAPISSVAWVKQRTRWFKGWMQTWLVHMRNPIELANQIGLYRFVMFQILTAGMIVSSLVYPFLLIAISVCASHISSQEYDVLDMGILCFDCLSILLGYFSFVLLSFKTLNLRHRGSLKIYLLTVPIYWLYLSVAAWRALIHVFTKPFEWEKTRHGKCMYISNE